MPIFIPPIAPQSPSSIIWGWYNRPVVAAVPSGLSLTPLRIKKKNSLLFLPATYLTKIRMCLLYLWDLCWTSTCGRVGGYQRFGRTFCVKLEGRSPHSKFRDCPSSSILKNTQEHNVSQTGSLSGPRCWYNCGALVILTQVVQWLRSALSNGRNRVRVFSLTWGRNRIQLPKSCVLENTGRWTKPKNPATPSVTIIKTLQNPHSKILYLLHCSSNDWRENKKFWEELIIAYFIFTVIWVSEK
jgi:hypothetical protein